MHIIATTFLPFCVTLPDTPTSEWTDRASGAGRLSSTIGVTDVHASFSNE
jgi:hypothetical protein